MVCFLKIVELLIIGTLNINVTEIQYEYSCQKCFLYEGAKLWNSISNGIKTIENISKFKTLLKKWNGSPCICKK